MRYLRRNSRGGAAATIRCLHTLLNSNWNMVYSVLKETGRCRPNLQGKVDRTVTQIVTLRKIKCNKKGSVRNSLLQCPLKAIDSPANSLFTPKKLAVRSILAFCAVTERLRDFRSGLLAAYVDLRKAVDSMNRDVAGEFWPSAEYRLSSSI